MAEVASIHAVLVTPNHSNAHLASIAEGHYLSGAYFARFLSFGWLCNELPFIRPSANVTNLESWIGHAQRNRLVEDDKTNDGEIDNVIAKFLPRLSLK